MKKKVIGMLVLIVCAQVIQIASASDMAYQGPQLYSDYKGAVLIDNSQFSYSSAQMQTFDIGAYVNEHHADLSPLVSTIHTWSSMQRVHPKVLAEAVDSYLIQNQGLSTKDKKQFIFEMSSAMRAAFDQFQGNKMAATKAWDAVSKFYNLGQLPDSKFSDKVTYKNEALAGLSPPPLYSYFQPPWLRGVAWAGGGVHSGNNDNALDFWGTDPYIDWGDDDSNEHVTATQSGVVSIQGSNDDPCFVQVVHPNGWVSQYYHVGRVSVVNGQSVQAGEKIAVYSSDQDQALCEGGFSSGPHVHYSQVYQNNAIVIDESNMDFTSFKHHASDFEDYDTDCSRSYYVKLPSNDVICPWYDLLNDTVAITDEIFSDGFEG